MDVAIRELKAKLSTYVKRAASGEEVVVTDRGRPVAVLGPLNAERTLQAAIEEGWVTPAKRTGLAPVKRWRADASTLDVLREDRDE